MRMHKYLSYSICLTLLAALTGNVQAALQSRLGGLAYYDDVLDITWVGDPILAASNTFGLTKSASQYAFDPGTMGSTGRMTKANADLWIAGMNAANYLGKNSWRLPTMTSVHGGTMLSTTFSNNGTTDWGYGATGIGWQTGSGEIVSELGYMYYGNLGNLGSAAPNDADPGSIVPQPGGGFSNAGPFPNIIEAPQSAYWTGVNFEPAVLYTWGINFDSGRQSDYIETNGLFAWAVLDGDIAPIPLPGAFWLFAAGIIGMLRFRGTNSQSLTPVNF